MNPTTDESEPIAFSGELVSYEPPQPTTLFGTSEPQEVLARATEVADALKGVLVDRKLTTLIQGKEHVNIEGWQLLGSMLGVTAVCITTEPVDGGWKATVQARTFDGRVVGQADGICTKHEKKGPWKHADDYAILSMAQTRGSAKALKGPLGFVVSLAGYQTTPAEEMPESPVNATMTQTEVQLDPLDFGDDPILAEELAVAFRSLNYKRAKVRTLLAGATTDDERRQLLEQQLQLIIALQQKD